jgi:hypothetical protein
MISPESVRQLAQSTEKHCITLYLNTGPNLNRSQFAARFHNLARNLNSQVPAADSRVFERVAARVTNFLNQYRPAANSILIVASEAGWQEFASRVPVRDEVWWGAPNTNQLLWLLDEYRPYGLLVAEQLKVGFLAVRLNEFEEFKEFSTDIDTSTWREQNAGSSPGRGGVRGGRNTDSFDHRYLERVKAFWRTLHRPLADLVERYHIRRIVLAGSKAILPDFAKTLPAKLSELVIAQVHMDALSNPHDAVKRVWPEISAWELRRDQAVVKELLNAAGISNRAAVGIEPALKFVQEGRAARLVVSTGSNQMVTHCASCQFVSSNNTSNCRNCGADVRQKSTLEDVLPRLVATHSVPVLVVKGDAATELDLSGGVGVFLRF